MTDRRRDSSLLDLAEAVAAGRTSFEAASADAGRAGPGEADELADLVLALRAVSEHATATREAVRGAAHEAEPGAVRDVPQPRAYASRTIGRPQVRTRCRLANGSTQPWRMAGLAAAVVLVAVTVATTKGPLLSVGQPGHSPPIGSAPAQLVLVATGSTFEHARLTDVARGGPGLVLVGATYDSATVPARSSDGAVWTSQDGRSWQPSGAGQLRGGFVSGVAIDGDDGRIVAVGSAGPTLTTTDRMPAIWTSRDGGQWVAVTGQTPPEIGGLRDIVATGPGFVTVGTLRSDGSHAFAMTSSDGLTWQRAPFVDGATGRGMTGAVVGGPGLIAWGYREDGDALRPALWTSTDGGQWDLATFEAGVGAAADPSASALGGEIQTVAGGTGAWMALTTDAEGALIALESTDGRTWRVAAAGADAAAAGFAPTSAVLVGESWLILGSQRAADGGAEAAALEWSDTSGWRTVDVSQPAGGGTWELRGGANSTTGSVILGGSSESGERSAIWQTP